MISKVKEELLHFPNALSKDEPGLTKVWSVDPDDPSTVNYIVGYLCKTKDDGSYPFIAVRVDGAYKAYIPIQILSE